MAASGGHWKGGSFVSAKSGASTNLASVDRKSLTRMSDEQLGSFQRGLGDYRGTGQERKAREINKMVLDERKRRENLFGF